jgi:ATP-binding protein involved in chromosome partitioning
MPLNNDQVVEALRAVRYPGFSRDIVSFGVVAEIELDGANVRVRLELGSAAPAVAEQMRREATSVVRSLPGVETVEVTPAPGAGGSNALPMAGAKAPPSVASRGALDTGLIPGVRHTVAVASGKGGVGKSTVAVHLAAAIAAGGARVGLLDVDIYGPSIPLMMGMQGQRPQMDPSGARLEPFERFGVRFMSLGFLVEPESAVIWRGPMVMKAIEQLLRDVNWGELDLMLLDMPPGTGDAQLTVSQRLRLSGAVIVTTPQDVALADATKAVAMFRKVDVPILGLVENMSYFLCPHCSERSEIFGHDGGRAEAERLGVPFLGQIPLDAVVRRSGDEGEPLIGERGASAPAVAFGEVAGRVLASIEETPSKQTSP